MTDTGPRRDEHPEDLLDLAARGEIGRADRQELQRHLARCLPCAAQLRIASLARPARETRSSDAYLDRVAVYRALERASDRRSFRGLLTQRWVPVGVGMLLLSSGAFAATWWSARHAVERSKAVALFGPGGGMTAPRRHVLASADGAPASPAVEGPTEVTSRGERAPQPPSGGGARANRSSAGELFARARRLRLGGDSTGALAIYRRLQREYGDSREGHLSYLVAGRLWLERDRPELAAAQFSRYLETGGSATEEALVGRAAALGRLGRSSDEAMDWQRLLSEHPTTVYASRARTRLGELRGRDGALDSVPGPP